MIITGNLIKDSTMLICAMIEMHHVGFDVVCDNTIEKGCYSMDTDKREFRLNEFEYLDYKEFCFGTIQQRTKPSEN